MDAIEFVKQLRRMNKQGVPKNRFIYPCAGQETDSPEEVVAEVEEWAKDNPVKTRQSEFLKQWPDAQLDCCGIVEICPSDIDTTIHQNCSADKCGGCRREFWLAEVDDGSAD